MAWCPFAVRQEIPETWQQPRIHPTTLIFHRAVSSADSLRDYWNSPGVVVESHFYIGRDGTLYQFVDTEVRADANWDANGFAISVETWDGGNTPDDMPWNDAQIATAKRLAAWVCEVHPDVPRRAATTWNSGGIGGHNWFAGPWAGGPRGCPGTARNNQIRNDIIPAAVAGYDWRTGEDMPSAAEVVDELLTRRLHFRIPDKADPRGYKETSESLANVFAALYCHTFWGLVVGNSTPWGPGIALQLAALVARPVADIDESQLTVTTTLTDAQLDAIAKRTNDLDDARDRDGDPRTGAVS